MNHLLEVQDLRTYFSTPQGLAKAVDGVSFSLEQGQTLALVGESGCGKTILAHSISRIIRRSNVHHPTGAILFKGQNLLTSSPKELEQIRGHRLSMIFQEPMAALNPIWKIRDQIAEPLIGHLELSRGEAYKRALELLEDLGVPSPDRVMNTWPHTLSGGMRQRVAIAMALACKPDLLIADEPTTALDVTIQAQILRLIGKMQKQFGMSVILITHDLGIVNEIAKDVLVMYSGRICESGPTADILNHPKHPYTKKLLATIPRLDGPLVPLNSIPGQVRGATNLVDGCRFADRCEFVGQTCLGSKPPKYYSVGAQQVSCFIYDPKDPLQSDPVMLSEAKHLSAKRVQKNPRTLLEIKELKTWFPIQQGLFYKQKQYVRAVDLISLNLAEGESLGLVGESGCGKSTLGLTILKLVQATSGHVVFMGGETSFDVVRAKSQELKLFRNKAQIIFQDPFASLNPRFSVREIIEEGLRVHHPKMTEDDRDKEVAHVLVQVGLPAESRFKFPHEFSGGQRQRIAIARAIILKPSLLVLDEATSALDVSIQAQVLNLLQDLKEKFGLTYVFITHNLGVVRYITDKIAVMYLGEIVEWGPTIDVLKNPKHPYTKTLIESVPSLIPHARLPEPLEGELPSPVNPPTGCRFHPRCPVRKELKKKGVDVGICQNQPPEEKLNDSNHHRFRCHF